VYQPKSTLPTASGGEGHVTPEWELYGMLKIKQLNRKSVKRVTAEEPKKELIIEAP
jgi:hypothetical protein